MSQLAPLLEACPLRPIAHAADQYAANIILGLDRELATAQSTQDFLDTTHLTDATASFLRMALDRVSQGQNSTAPSVYQLYSRYGGGKTHSLLLLAAASKFPHLPYWSQQVDAYPNAARFIAFDGADANVQTGVQMDDQGNYAKSLAGYILYRLGGPAALRAFAQGDHNLADPGAAAFQRLIGDERIIIVIDELIQYINRVQQRIDSGDRVSADGTLTTISALANAVASSPRAILVITTPEDSNDLLQEHTGPGDAYQADALQLNAMLERIDSQLGRIMHPIAPSGEADLPAILRKRLFHGIDEDERHRVSLDYATIAGRNGRDQGSIDYQGFHASYPFHPSLLEIITHRLSANRNFQRVRGTLRLLGNTLLDMQRQQSDAALVHPHHVTPRSPQIRDELVNRTGFTELDPAIDTDILGPNSTVARAGSDLAEAAAVTMLLGTIAPDASNGLYADQIADAILSPEHSDYGVISGNVEAFLSKAIYVDDSPDTQRKRFSRDANVMKELLEYRDTILSNTDKMSNLIRCATGSAYQAGQRSGDYLEAVIFPGRQSNVPDDPSKAYLGIINPDFWNFTGAENTAHGMSHQDLVDLHRHSRNNNGNASRLYPNNALFLAAHDANLRQIREDVATMEAADALLNEKDRAMPEHRRETLKQIRADSEKHATTGIQNKFTHLFSAGNSDQHQWPPQTKSHIEHRLLESITDATGRGQDMIIQALGDRILRGDGAGLHRTAWERVNAIAKEDGCTLGELRHHFASNPDHRIVVNDATWRALIANAVSNDALHIRTPSGEQNPDGYSPDWLVWLKGFEPKAKPDTQQEQPPAQPAPPAPRPTPDSAPTKPRSYTTGLKSGREAYASVRQFMADNDYQWSQLESCQVRGTAHTLADQIASIAQGNDSGISITVQAQNQNLRLAIHDQPPREFKNYSTSAKRLMENAGINAVDVTVRLAADAAERVLDKLNNRDDANITVNF